MPDFDRETPEGLFWRLAQTLGLAAVCLFAVAIITQISGFAVLAALCLAGGAICLAAIGFIVIWKR